jgi:subtilisin family serine protease
MARYIVSINHPGDRGHLAKHGKVGRPQSLNTIIVYESDLTKEEIEKIEGVLEVEEERRDEPSAVQRNPDSWFLPSASNTAPDYTYNKTGAGVAIYVMDSGIRFDHVDFEGRDVATIYSFDGRDFGTNVDGPDHGTMAASCAAGNLHGIAKGATVYNLRYDWTNIEGIKALDTMFAHYKTQTKPAILSMSFGSYSNIYDKVFTTLAENGIVLVAAAGNYDEPVPTFPARRSDVIAVAACDKNLRPSVWGGTVTPGTSYGPMVDIWAGGTAGTAAGIYSRTSTQWAGGTSSACPLVAGAMALILEGSKKLTSYNEVLAVKAKLIAQSRKDVIQYFDPKFNDTPNRYIYTLGEVPVPPVGEPTPTPTPTPDEKPDTGRDKGALYIVGALILAAILLVFLGAL